MSATFDSAMGSNHSHSQEVQVESTTVDPKQPLSLPIQNRRTPSATLAPPEPQLGSGLPIKSRRTRGVTLEPAPGRETTGYGERTLAAPPDMVRSPAVLSSPASQSKSHGSHPGTPSVQIAQSARSRVHFATSPASVVEITPYSWASSASSPVFESPTSPHLWMNTLHLSPPTGYPAAPSTQAIPSAVAAQVAPAAPPAPAQVMLPLQAVAPAVPAAPAVPSLPVTAGQLSQAAAVPPMLPQQVFWRAPAAAVTAGAEWSGNPPAPSVHPMHRQVG